MALHRSERKTGRPAASTWAERLSSLDDLDRGQGSILSRPKKFYGKSFIEDAPQQAFKARPHSTVKVPDSVPAWKQSLWRKVWRAAFMVLEDEAAARRIASYVVTPPAMKLPADLAIPADVPAEKARQWAQVVVKAETYTDSEKAREIAYRVIGQKDRVNMAAKSATATNEVADMTGVLVHRKGGAIKSAEISLDDPNIGIVEGYLVSWGHPGDTDLQGEFFTPRTDFCLDWFNERPVLYHHGMDGTTGLKKIGSFTKIKADDLGLWVQAQLDLRDKYARAVYDMVKMKQFGWSSGSVDHLVKIAENGEIKVWPLIEGSITPTPAQPAKTTVRALKALLSEESGGLTEWLRGLEARVDKGHAPAFDAHRSSDTVEGVKSMSYDSTYLITRAVAKAFGLKDVTAEELEAVASEVAPVVTNEVAAAADELVAAQGDDFPVMADEEILPLRSFYRSDDELPVMTDELETAALSDELAAQMEDEMLTDAAARALRRRAWKRAIRQIAEGEAATEPAHMGVPASEDPLPLLHDTTKRVRRSYRTDEEIPVATDEVTSEVLNDVAAQAYRTGFRTGLRSAYRQIDEQPTISADEVAAAEMEEALASLADPTVMTEEDVEAAARAYRLGYQKGLNRAIRQAEEEAFASDLEEEIKADAYYTPDAGATDYSSSPDGYFPVEEGGTLPQTKRLFRRGFRADEELPVMADECDPAAMSDDEFEAAMADEEIMTKNYQPRLSSRAVRSAGYNSEVEYWKARALQYEQMEAPGQRNSFKSLSNFRVVDEADRPGAYEHAFKSYLHRGLAALMDSEKYVLMGKGKANWQGASFGYDPATKSIKTYTSGSDASVGFLVPEDWVNELNKNIMTQTVMAGECRTRTTTSDRIIQPNLLTTDARRAHAAQVQWPGESPTNNTSHRTTEDQYSQISIPIHVMLISLATTNSSLEDSTFNLEEEINEAFSEAVAVAYDQLIWAGDGIGKMQGIVVNEQVVGHPSLGMQTVGGYVATGSRDGIVTADTLKAMLFHLPQSYRQRAKWYMNSNTGLQIATLKDGEGNYLIDQRDESLRAVGIPDRLLGKPIVYNEWASDVADGAFPIILGDLSRGYIIGRRVEFSIRRFDDSNYAEHDQVLFLGRARLGGQVIQPAAYKVLKVASA